MKKGLPKKKRGKVFFAFLGTAKTTTTVPGGSITWEPGQIRHIRAAQADALGNSLLNNGLFREAVTVYQAAKTLAVPVAIVRKIADVKVFELEPEQKDEVLVLTPEIVTQAKAEKEKAAKEKAAKKEGGE